MLVCLCKFEGGVCVTVWMHNEEREEMTVCLCALEVETTGESERLGTKEERGGGKKELRRRESGLD